MIDLYTFTTPNGRKPAILLEELGLPYQIKMVNIAKGEQFSPEFVAINPNSKIPALVDQETGITVFESGAMLMYLAEKTGKFLPTDIKARYQVIEWLMFQMGGVGPMFGQLGHFRNAAPEKIDYALNRYEKETLRLLEVLERQLTTFEFIAGDYSIADMATYPWVVAYESWLVKDNRLNVNLAEYAHLSRWKQTMKQRPAVQRGMALGQNPS